MTSKLVRILTAAVFVISLAALAQTDSAASPLPAAPSAAASPTTPPATGSKVGTIDINQAIFLSNEGQRDFEVLTKKLEPKQTELKGMSDELESLKKQLNTQTDKLNDTSRATLVKQIEQKQKLFERSMQDARDDAQAQQNEIAQRILQKMAPMIVKYAGENGYGVIIDTSNPWPQGPVLWAGASMDITKAVVDGYNVQSGVAAPVRPAASAKPATAPAKPATAPATKPPAPK